MGPGSFNSPVADYRNGLCVVHHEVPEPGGDVAEAQSPEDRDGRVAKRRQRLGACVGPHAALVFVEAHVAHAEETVLDRPVRAPDPKEVFRTGALARKTRHQILDLARALAAYGPMPSDLRELFRAGPVGVAGENPRHLDAARLAPAMGLAALLEDLDLTPPDALLVGGKRVRPGRSRCRP